MLAESIALSSALFVDGSTILAIDDVEETSGLVALVWFLAPLLVALAGTGMIYYLYGSTTRLAVMATVGALIFSFYALLCLVSLSGYGDNGEAYNTIAKVGRFFAGTVFVVSLVFVASPPHDQFKRP